MSPPHRVAGALVALAWLASGPAGAQPAATQISRDPSLVDPMDAGPILPEADGVTFIIDEKPGERSQDGEGTSLFHSFEHFDLDTPDTALFTADPSKTTNVVYNRVTGGSPTNLFGTIASGEELANARFYFFNSRGLILGPDFSLDVTASFSPFSSFTGSTANVLEFSDGVRWPTDRAEAGNFSDASPALVEFTTDSPAAITVDREGASQSLAFGTRDVSLIGGDIELRGSGSRLGTLGTQGVVELASVAGPAQVPLDLSGFDPAGLGPGGTILLTNAARVEAREGAQSTAEVSPARVVIRGGRLVVEQGSTVTAQVENRAALDAEGEPLPLIDVGLSDQLQLSGGSIIQANTANGTAEGGDLVVRARSVLLESDGPLTALGTQTSNSSGAAGDIDIQAERVELRGQDASRDFATEIRTNTRRAVGEDAAGGAIRIAADEVEILGETAVRALSEQPGPGNAPGGGDGGDIELRGTDLVRIADGASVFTQTDSPDGAAGRIAIRDSAEIRIEGGGEVSTRIQGLGGSGEDAPQGEILIQNADRVRVAGEGGVGGLITFTEGGADAGSVRLLDISELSIVDGGVVSSIAAGDAAGGSVEILADQVDVANGGGIVTQTLGDQPSGDISILAGRLTIDGSLSRVDASSGDIAFGRTGAGGSIDIDVGQLELLGGGVVRVTAQGPGGAGDIDVEADSIRISGSEGLNRSRIVSESLTQAGVPEPGAGGSITIRADELELSDDGQISVESFSLDSGPPGSILVLADQIRIENSLGALNATSESDFDAGDIDVRGRGRLLVVDGSITTSSALSSGGNVTIEMDSHVLLRGSSPDPDQVEAVSARALGATEMTQGGNITIRSDTVNLDQAKLVADAPDGAGGDIVIEAEGFFVPGGQLRQDPDQAGLLVAREAGGTTSIVDVSGMQPGDFEAPTPDAAVVSQLASLEQDFLDVSELARDFCAAREQPAGSLVLQSRERAPAAPRDRLPTRYFGNP